MSIIKTDGVIFDLDGTLWDSTDEICLTWGEVLEAQADIKKAPTVAELKSVMGMASKELMETLFPYISYERGQELFKLCCAREDEYLSEHGAKLYPGITELLEKLSADLPLFIVSNCDIGYIPAFFAGHGTGRFFKDYECVGRTGKPKAENIRLVVKRNSLKFPVYVGDTRLDYESAAAAGVPFIHAAYGFGDVQNVPKIEKPLELLNIICQV